jgi:hypothetical protein
MSTFRQPSRNEPPDGGPETLPRPPLALLLPDQRQRWQRGERALERRAAPDGSRVESATVLTTVANDRALL